MSLLHLILSTNKLLLLYLQITDTDKLELSPRQSSTSTTSSLETGDFESSSLISNASQTQLLPTSSSLSSSTSTTTSNTTSARSVTNPHNTVTDCDQLSTQSNLTTPNQIYPQLSSNSHRRLPTLSLNRIIAPTLAVSTIHPAVQTLISSRPLNHLLQPRRSLVVSETNLNTTSISHLPNDLLHLIISFIPAGNYRESFAQNILLSTVNRHFCSCVYSKLRHEIHISSSTQIRRLDLALKQNPTRIDQIKFLTIDLDIDTLRWNASNLEWAGSSFQSLIRQLESVPNISISLRRNSDPSILSIASDLCESTGGDRPIFEQFSKAVEMRLSFQLSDMERRQLLTCHSSQLRRLSLATCT